MRRTVEEVVHTIGVDPHRSSLRRFHNPVRPPRVPRDRDLDVILSTSRPCISTLSPAAVRWRNGTHLNLLSGEVTQEPSRGSCPTGRIASPSVSRMPRCRSQPDTRTARRRWGRIQQRRGGSRSHSRTRRLRVVVTLQRRRSPRSRRTTNVSVVCVREIGREREKRDHELQFPQRVDGERERGVLTSSRALTNLRRLSLARMPPPAPSSRSCSPSEALRVLARVRKRRSREGGQRRRFERVLGREGRGSR
jgi:hypothetical protein